MSLPDGTCIWFNNDPGSILATQTGAGGTEVFAMTNGASGTYTITARDWSNSGGDFADIRIYGNNGSVNLTP